MDCKVEFVLNLSVKGTGFRCKSIVIDAGSIDICNLLVEAALAEANLAYLSQQVLKVIQHQELAVLHSLAVEHIISNGKVS